MANYTCKAEVTAALHAYTPYIVVFRYMEYSVLHYKYEAIKIKHHATKTYFTKNRPLAVVSQISNVGYEKWNISQDFINQSNKIYLRMQI